MKKSILKRMLYLVLAIGMTSAFTACSDDDDEGPGNKSDLIGTWKVTQHIYEEKLNGVVEESNNYGEEKGETFTLKENGTSDFDGPCKWDYSGGKLIFTFTYEDEDDDYENYNVVELTTTNLTMEAKYTDKENGKTWDIYEKYVCKKVTSDNGQQEETENK